MYESSELIINEDGSVFHLHLKPEQIADRILLVGDRERTDMIASFFDSVECTVQNREFRTITGMYKGKRISALSTGIGVGNIDIVMNELDILANVDLSTRCDKHEHRRLTLVRCGTCGGLQPEVPEGTFVISRRSIGFDGVLGFYDRADEVCDLEFCQAFVEKTCYSERFPSPYCAVSSPDLLKRIAGDDMVIGNNITSPGFYGPQGRVIRLSLADSDLNDRIMSFEYNGERITNYEMEAATIAGLASLMGHDAVTCCLVIANRLGKRFIGDYKPYMRRMIEEVLDRI